MNEDITSYDPQESARRILIVGPIGSGKSYSAEILSNELDLPVLNLDRVMLDDYGTPKQKDRFIEDAAIALESSKYRDGWIVDGTFRSLRALTWDNADVIGYLRPVFLVNAGLVALRGMRKDVRGGNSLQPTGVQIRRLLNTRSEDIHKIDSTVLEYNEKGRKVVVARSSSSLVRRIVSVVRT